MGVLVLVGTEKGAALLRSSPDREEWELDALRFKGWRVTAAARDGGGRCYVAVTSEVYGAAIMVSDDFEEWRQLEDGPRYEGVEPGSLEHNRIIGRTDALGQHAGPGRHLDQIWRLHTVGNTIYAGVSEAGLFRSDDRGESWQPLRGLNDHPTRPTWEPGFGGLCVHSVLTDARDPSRIWVGISAAGVFRSDDGGKTWEPKNEGVPAGEGHCVHGLAHDPEDAAVIYRQDHRGMYRTADGGDSWERIETGLPLGRVQGEHRAAFGFPIEMDRETNAVYAIPLEGDNYRFPHGGKLRVYRTRDGGGRWEALEHGLPENHTYTNVLRGAMSVDGLDPCGVYFGTTAGTLYVGQNGGDSWTQFPWTLPRILCVEAFEV